MEYFVQITINNLRFVGDMHIVLPSISLLMKELLNRLNITPSPQSNKSEIVVRIKIRRSNLISK